MNSFGRLFKVTIYGESHGKGVGVIIDGAPEGIEFSQEDIMPLIQRRRSGIMGTTKRLEEDIPLILSGIFNGKTTGSPINVFFENKNNKPSDYEKIINIPRPGHADFTAQKKYRGFNDYRGGGQLSGRLTLPLLPAGALALKIFNFLDIKSSLVGVAGNYKDIKSNIEEAEKKKDSCGALCNCIVKGFPIGLGEPFFDSVESLISHIIFSIPGVKGIEFGAGFKSANMFGSEHNDSIINFNGKTLSNNNGGINGGISNGNEIVFNIAFKPSPSIGKEQKSINFKSGNVEKFCIEGRHDVCYALRVMPVVEASTAIVLSDLLLIEKNNGVNYKY